MTHYKQQLVWAKKVFTALAVAALLAAGYYLYSLGRVYFYGGSIFHETLYLTLSALFGTISLYLLHLTYVKKFFDHPDSDIRHLLPGKKDYLTAMAFGGKKDGIPYSDGSMLFLSSSISVILLASAIPSLRVIYLNIQSNTLLDGLPALILPTLAVISCIWALGIYRRWEAFGESRLFCPESMFLGQKFSVTLQTAREVKPVKDFIITLECWQTRYIRTRERTQGQRTKLWSNTTRLPATSSSTMSGVPIEIEIPAEQPASGPDINIEDSANISWLLNVTSHSSKRLRYYAEFPLYISMPAEEAELKKTANR